MTAPARPLPSYARDAEHAARIAEHFARLCDEAPPLPPRLEHLLRPDAPTPLAENAA